MLKEEHLTINLTKIQKKRLEEVRYKLGFKNNQELIRNLIDIYYMYLMKGNKL